MKAAYIFATLPSTACAIAAGYMAINGIHDWGWFMVGAYLLFPSLHTDSKQDKSE